MTVKIEEILDKFQCPKITIGPTIYIYIYVCMYLDIQLTKGMRVRVAWRTPIVPNAPSRTTQAHSYSLRRRVLTNSDAVCYDVKYIHISPTLGSCNPPLFNARMQSPPFFSSSLNITFISPLLYEQIRPTAVRTQLVNQKIKCHWLQTILINIHPLLL